MKCKGFVLCAALATTGLMLGSGCDWSSNGGSFNTSQGAGININFSGVYRGMISGKAVERTTAGTIASLTIQQAGNRIDVTDSQGSRYVGSVGSPRVVSDTGGTFPPGAELLQAQINWAGKDGVAQRDVEFVGIIHAVSVTEIEGDTKTTTQTSSSGSTSQQGDNYTYSTSSSVVSNQVLGQTITETTRAFDGDGNLVYEEVKTTTIPPSGDVTTTTRVLTDNRTKTSSNNTTTTQTTTKTFQLNEANVQYRLEGTWIEKNSPIVSRVDALSRGTFGIITIVNGESQEGGTGGGSGGGGATGGGTTGGT